MNQDLRRDADEIIAASLKAVLPDEAVRRALQSFRPGSGRVLLAAAGKAAWQMAAAAVNAMGSVDGGVVVTKYGHVRGEIPGVVCCEAGHPVPDENGYAATARALELVRDLTEEDTVLFLLSGGGRKLAFLAGGETVVHLTGQGMGGRNQELALAAAPGLEGLAGAAVFSVGSDGTDGPTDAAGGYVDEETMPALRKKGIDVYQVLKDNDAWHALQASGGLIVTGPTGTNVNDVAVALLQG